MKHDIIKELFESLKKRYHEGLETKMKEPFAFENVDLLYCSSYKTRLRKGKSYIVFSQMFKKSTK